MKNKVTKLIIVSLLMCSTAFADAPMGNPASREGENAPSAAVKVEVQPATSAPSSASANTGTGFSDSSSGPQLLAGTPIERAKGEKLATAMGHYARARSLVVAAIREFDKGYALVDPNALLDSRMWRDSLLDRSDELARLLDPQPRATKGGVKFGSETRGIGDTSR